MPINGWENNGIITADFHSTACNVCGEKHETRSCQFLSDLKYVKDEPLISRARQTLPKNLGITRMADGSTTIVAKCDFQRGTTFGPMQAARDRTMNPMNDFPIKVFGDSPADTYHLDRSDEETSNWMSFVSPASNSLEQNLICYQMQRDVYYTAMRFIPKGERLCVWYAPYYASRMKMPLYDREFANILDNDRSSRNETSNESNDDKKNRTELWDKNIQEIAQSLPAKRLGARGDKTSWNCSICWTAIPSVIEYAKHLMEHYKPLLGVFCDICNEKFHRISVLQKHKRMKHQQQQDAQTILRNTSQKSEATKGEKSMEECNSSASVEREKDSSNESSLLDGNSMNVSDLLQNSSTLMENSSLKSILENQCLNMSMGPITDSILSDNISGVDSVRFNVEELTSELLNITEDGDDTEQRINNFRCDICEKTFEKADYLYRHLRKHTGEFICRNCLGVFARKENLVTHLCPSQKIDYRKYECLYCQKLFVTKKYLKRHMIKHTELNVCKWCRNLFASSLELEAHECQAPKHLCSQCGKRFVHREHLNRHAKLHANPKPIAKKSKKRISTEKPVICEKCGDVFKNPYSLKQHLRSHGERKFECDVCHSKFHRIGVLQQHKSVHQSIQIPCQICGKKMKSKKALSVHVLLHGNRKFHCEKCDKSFFQRCNYLKHYRQLHSDKVLHKCPHCPVHFTSELSFNKHLESHVKPTQHPCKSCHKVFHREYQLKRHVQTNHSGIVFRCPYCKMTARYRHSMKRHFERQHKNMSDEWDKPGFVNDLMEKSSASLLIERLVSPDQSSRIPRMLEKEKNNAGIDKNNSDDLILSVRGLDENRFDEQIRISENVSDDVAANSLNGGEILLQVSEIRQEESTISGDNELTSNEIPQLSISDTDANLTDSILGNAYIFDEEGSDIMFYVLDNTPVIAEY